MNIQGRAKGQSHEKMLKKKNAVKEEDLKARAMVETRQNRMV